MVTRDNLSDSSTNNNLWLLLENMELVAKTIDIDAEHIDFISKQLAEPQTFRPLKPLSQGVDRDFVYDTKQQIWTVKAKKTGPREFKVIQRRNGKTTGLGATKDTPFTKKTAVTLLPPNGKMGFYNPRKNATASYRVSQKMGVYCQFTYTENLKII